MLSFHSTALWGRWNHYSHFTGEETYQVTWLASFSRWGWSRDWTSGQPTLKLVLNTRASSSVQVRMLTCIECWDIASAWLLSSDKQMQIWHVGWGEVFLLFLPVEIKPQTGECVPIPPLSVLVPCRDSVTLDPALVVFGISYVTLPLSSVSDKPVSKLGHKQVLWLKTVFPFWRHRTESLVWSGFFRLS